MEFLLLNINPETHLSHSHGWKGAQESLFKQAPQWFRCDLPTEHVSSLGFHLTSECVDVLLSYHLPNGNPGGASVKVEAKTNFRAEGSTEEMLTK